MELFDDLADIFDIAKDIAMLPVKIAEAAVECATDIGELVAKDVGNRVSGRGDVEIETSYGKRDRAEKLVERATEKYNRMRGELEAYWNEVVTYANTVGQKRAKVYQLLNRAIGNENIVQLNQNEFVNIYKPYDPHMDKLKFNAGTLMGLPGANMRMEAAEEYLINAKEYELDISDKIADLKTIKNSAEDIRNVLEEENEMLGIITSAYTQKKAKALNDTANTLTSICNDCLNVVNENSIAKYKDLLTELRIMW